MSDRLTTVHSPEGLSRSAHIAFGQYKKTTRPPISLADIYRKFLQFYKLPSKSEGKKNNSDQDDSEDDEINKPLKNRKLGKNHLSKNTKQIKRRVTLPNLPSYLKQ